mmetsp:Transcript_104716/g.303068  ORF Transcript_104716/g.303068 Transcript_104716/m.303068 type:complete len:372 (-) Transcript_104716:232-1347(-)|eukprot:CAMPEP_0176099278 /NCGR_PEP_ID=MMETSP0120_2-20121206/49786_1 /TAXON_ID=160619 /ORGANISM="Kryptoperidinium foliaceum, Strain CCMP 1326" /LENGTH=371 /DNA_ID=CAMNT_0017433305 /DNA_START=32 /DNA_END=1147 /DNA_ORIENTATION=+
MDLSFRDLASLFAAAPPVAFHNPHRAPAPSPAARREPESEESESESSEESEPERGPKVIPQSGYAMAGSGEHGVSWTPKELVLDFGLDGTIDILPTILDSDGDEEKKNLQKRRHAKSGKFLLPVYSNDKEGHARINEVVRNAAKAQGFDLQRQNVRWTHKDKKIYVVLYRCKRGMLHRQKRANSVPRYRPTRKEDLCPFSFHVYYNVELGRWYIKEDGPGSITHRHHHPVEFKEQNESMNTKLLADIQQRFQSLCESAEGNRGIIHMLHQQLEPMEKEVKRRLEEEEAKKRAGEESEEDDDESSEPSQESHQQSPSRNNHDHEDDRGGQQPAAKRQRVSLPTNGDASGARATWPAESSQVPPGAGMFDGIF